MRRGCLPLIITSLFCIAFAVALIVSVKVLFIDDYNHNHEAMCEVLACSSEQYSCDRSCYGGSRYRRPVCTSYSCYKVQVTLELMNITDEGLPYIDEYSHVYTRSDDNNNRAQDPRICNPADSNMPKGILKPFVTCYYDDRHPNSTITLRKPGHSGGSIAAMVLFSLGVLVCIIVIISVYFCCFNSAV